MPNSIITVENVSKKFIISHDAPERYKSLRDAMADRVKGLVGRGKKRLPTADEEFYALKDINFEVYPGDRLGIIGRNGAGKSTLLKILSRITEPSAGRITIRGRVASLLEVGTGFHPELTGRENIFLNGAILGMGRAEIRKKFDEIVDFAEVEKFLDTPVKRYSSGMYVRLAFAVAAHLEPEILVVDEVLAVGDAQFQKKCLGKMEDVSKNEGRTILFVSHNMGVVSQLCNKGILLNRGEILTKDGARKCIDSYMQLSNSLNYLHVYKASEKTREKKANYILEVFTSRNGEVCQDFGFEESVEINFKFVMKEREPGLLLAIGINDKNFNRIATIVKGVDFFKKNGEGNYIGKAILPPDLIAPNNYSFVAALWLKNGNAYDVVENVCPIKIHDTGSTMVDYEGVDYGSVVLDFKWDKA